MECSVFQLVLIAILPFPEHHQEKCGSMIYTTSLQVFIDTDKSPPLCTSHQWQTHKMGN